MVFLAVPEGRLNFFLTVANASSDFRPMFNSFVANFRQIL